MIVGNAAEPLIIQNPPTGLAYELILKDPTLEHTLFKLAGIFKATVGSAFIDVVAKAVSVHPAIVINAE